MTLPRGYAFEGKGDDDKGNKALAVVMPPETYFDDPPEKEDAPVSWPENREQKIVLAILELLDVPLDKLLLHHAALRRIMRKDRRSLRVIAKEIGVSHPTLLRAMDSIKRKFPRGSVPV